MYAVVKTGGKQYRVEAGETIQVEKLDGNPGQTLQFDQVLLLAEGESLTLGTPLVKGARVEAEITAQDRGSKVLIFKYRRRKRYRRKTGHRQEFTALKIINILGPQQQAPSV
jgi:large subunit ribosomal protein L21